MEQLMNALRHTDDALLLLIVLCSAYILSEHISFTICMMIYPAYTSCHHHAITAATICSSYISPSIYAYSSYLLRSEYRTAMSTMLKSVHLFIMHALLR